MQRIIGWLALIAGLVVAGWQGWEYRQRQQATVTAASDANYATEDAPALGNTSDIVTVEEGTATDPNLGATPMAQRVAVVGLLNKRNGQARDVTLKPGQAVRIGDVILRLRACEQTAPYEQEQLTGAFVQLDVRGLDNKWRRAFSGWLFKERPALNVVIHPVYDVWTKSCTMSFPTSGPADPDAPAAAGNSTAPARSRPRPAASASSAPNPAPTAAAPSPKADDSND